MATAPVRLDPWGPVPRARRAAVEADPVLARLFTHVEHSTVAKIFSEEGAANVALCSLSALKRHFRRLVGITFQAWRSQTVMVAAEELLARGIPVKEVARLTGYGSESAFCRAFSQRKGIGPGEFVRRRINKRPPRG